MLVASTESGTHELSVMELLRRCVRRTGSASVSTTSVLRRGDRIAVDELDHVPDAIGESIVPFVSELDEALPAPAKRVELRARAVYTLRRADHEGMLEYVNGFLDEPLTLELLAGETEIAGELEDADDDGLPLLGLRLLQHALAQELDVLVVHEVVPGMVGDERLWERVRDGAGEPGYVLDPELGSGDWDQLDEEYASFGPDELLTRGLVLSWSGDRDVAPLLELHARGDRRACRWLAGQPAECPPTFPLSGRQLAALLAGDLTWPEGESTFVVYAMEPVEERIGESHEKKRCRTAREAFEALGEYLLSGGEDRVASLDTEATQIAAHLAEDEDPCGEQVELSGVGLARLTERVSRVRSPWARAVLSYASDLERACREDPSDPWVEEGLEPLLYGQGGAPHDDWGFCIAGANEERSRTAPFRCEHALLPASPRTGPDFSEVLEALLARREAERPRENRAAPPSKNRSATAKVRDAKRIIEAARASGDIDHQRASDALVALLNHGERNDIEAAYDVVRTLVPLEVRTLQHVAYNLACAAAKLGRKADMLACLRAAKLDGDHPGDALGDRDFEDWHSDPDLRALAREP